MGAPGSYLQAIKVRPVITCYQIKLSMPFLKAKENEIHTLRLLYDSNLINCYYQ